MPFPIDIILNENPVPISDRLPNLEKQIAQIIDSALKKNPKKRIQDAAQLLTP